MCIIIDTNVFADVFTKESANHINFEPVFIWVSEGLGKIVYGGTKYKKELLQAKKYVKIFRLFSDARRVVHIPDDLVDIKEKELRLKIPEKELNDKFNDPHIVAIVIVSKCKIVCTLDIGLSEFLKISDYPADVDMPLIYSNKSNRDMLNHDNIVECCKPCEKLKKVKVSS
jgi:predicted nucleic acid-binding protein